jgi:hypothetical protein
MGTMARTAVVAGTATAVSGNVARRGEERAAEQQQAAAAQQQAAVPMQAAPEEVSYDDKIEQIKKAGALMADGLLTEEEFAAEKARILGS